jgi:Ca2+-binding RTX toxin-like protein
VHRSRGSGLATSLLAALALAATLLPAASADAVTVDGPLDGDPEDTSVDVVGDNGRDEVVVRLIGADTLAVTDGRGGVDAEGDCRQAGPAEARCPLYGTASPFVSLRGGKDFLRLHNSLTEYRYDVSCYAAMGPGNDLFRGVPVTGFLPVDVEGGRGRDSLFGGGSGYVSLDGDQGADRLVGGRGNDLLYGGVGDDLLLGRAGRDDLFGGPGFDTARGGRGDDSFRRVERILSR